MKYLRKHNKQEQQSQMLVVPKLNKIRQIHDEVNQGKEKKNVTEQKDVTINTGKIKNNKRIL